MQLNSEPNRISPVHERHQTLGARFGLREGWFVPEGYTSHDQETTALRESVGLIDISARGKLTLKGANAGAIIAWLPGKAPTNPGGVIEVEYYNLLVAKLTPDEFLVITPPGTERERAISLEAEITSQGAFVSIIDQTAGLVGFSLSGPKSRAVMSKLCALPFKSNEFPNMHVTQSSFANVRATIIRHDQDDTLTFELYTDRSYGDYLWDTILDAGREFKIQPVGWEAIEQ